MAIEAAAGFLRSIDGLEHDGQSRRVGQARLRTDHTMAHSDEGTLDQVRGAQELPVLGGEVVKGEQRVAVLVEASGGFLLYQVTTFNVGVESGATTPARPSRSPGVRSWLSAAGSSEAC